MNQTTAMKIRYEEARAYIQNEDVRLMKIRGRIQNDEKARELET